MFPFTLFFTGMTINIGYFFYRYFNFLFYPLKKIDDNYWHYLPSVLVILNFYTFYFFGSEFTQKSTYYDTLLSLDLPISMNIVLLLVLLLPILYLIKMIVDTYRNMYLLKKELAVFKPYFTFFLMLFIFFIGFVGFDILNKVFFNASSNSIMLKLLLIKPIFVMVIFFVIYKSPALLLTGSLNEIKSMGIPYWYLKSKSLSAINPHDKFESIWEIKKIILQIEALIEERNVFRSEKYNINDLAIDMHIPVGHLRFLYQEYCDLSFVEYRNYKRVEDFKFYARNKSESQNFTIEAVGGKCGFGSMSSLNRSVKKYENCTPSELWQNEN